MAENVVYAAEQPPPAYPEVAIKQPTAAQNVQFPTALNYDTSTGAVQVAPVLQMPAIPRGLEYMTAVDQLLVHQQVELGEILLGFETKNKYQVKNSVGQQVYFAKEDTDCCTRQCCGPLRPFDMKIKDNSDVEVIHLERPLRCQGVCCPCCLQELEVTSPSVGLLGTVLEEWSCFTQIFTVTNAAREPVLTIEGPCMPCRCCTDVEFDIYTVDGQTKVSI